MSSVYSGKSDAIEPFGEIHLFDPCVVERKLINSFESGRQDNPLKAIAPLKTSNRYFRHTFGNYQGISFKPSIILKTAFSQLFQRRGNINLSQC